MVRRPWIFGILFFIHLTLSIDGICQATDTTDVKIKWNHKLTLGINLNQIAYSHWEKGGDNSIAWNVRLDGESRRHGVEWEWLFTNIMAFGQMKQQNTDTRTIVDKLDLDGAVIWKLGSAVNPYFGMGLLTQFSKGYDYARTPPVAKSHFWDPGYLTQSAGARIRIKDIFNSHLGIGFKETMTDNYRQYSDNPDTEKIEEFRFETGIESKTKLNANISQSLNIRIKLEMFSSFENIRIIDLRWDSLFTAKITKFVVATLNVQLNYDKDVIDKIQIKELFGLGFSYNVF